MDWLKILFSILVIILSFSLTFIEVKKISFKNPKSISMKGWRYIMIILVIIGLSVTNIIIDVIKSKANDRTQNATKTNTENLLTNTEKSISKLENVSKRLEKLNPRLDLLEERTISSINKIDTSLKLFERYDSLQKLKFIESEPKILIDSVVYNYLDKSKEDIIRIYHFNYGKRLGVNFQIEAHYFFINNARNNIILDVPLTLERNKGFEILPNSQYHTDIQIKNPKRYKNGAIRIKYSYRDELLNKVHEFVEIYDIANSSPNNQFGKSYKLTCDFVEKYMKLKKLNSKTHR